MNNCLHHGAYVTSICFACHRGEKSLPGLPPIDETLIPHTKSDRNLPTAGAAGFNPRGRSVRMMPELGMGYGAEQRRARDKFDKLVAEQAEIQRAHSHYFKDVSKLQTVDVYRALSLFAVTDPCLQHAIKKLLVAGGRGVKNIDKDIQEAIDTLKRWQEMRAEDTRE